MTRLTIGLLGTALGIPLPAAAQPAPFRTIEATGTLDSIHARLNAGIDRRGLTVFARIDHAANATAAGLELRPTTVVIMGNPAAGTRLMQCDQQTAFELPLRVMVWEDGDGRPWISYTSTAFLARMYAMTPCLGVLDRVDAALTSLAREAAGSP